MLVKNSFLLLLYQEKMDCISGSFKLFLFVTQVMIQNYLSAIVPIQTLLTYFSLCLLKYFAFLLFFSHHLKAISLFERVTLPAEQMQASHESSKECSMAASGASL